jgi:hypothetical protein
MNTMRESAMAADSAKADVTRLQKLVRELKSTASQNEGGVAAVVQGATGNRSPQEDSLSALLKSDL